MITVERVSDQVFRVTLTAEVRISGSTDRPPGRVSAPKAAEPAGAGTVRSGGRPVDPVQLLTVEETAELLQVGRGQGLLPAPHRAAAQHKDREAPPGLAGLDRRVPRRPSERRRPLIPLTADRGAQHEAADGSPSTITN
jgi:hypothetical protein